MWLKGKVEQKISREKCGLLPNLPRASQAPKTIIQTCLLHQKLLVIFLQFIYQLLLFFAIRYCVFVFAICIVVVLHRSQYIVYTFMQCFIHIIHLYILYFVLYITLTSVALHSSHYPYCQHSACLSGGSHNDAFAIKENVMKFNEMQWCVIY